MENEAKNSGESANGREGKFNSRVYFQGWLFVVHGAQFCRAVKSVSNWPLQEMNLDVCIYFFPSPVEQASIGIPQVTTKEPPYQKSE